MARRSKPPDSTPKKGRSKPPIQQPKTDWHEAFLTALASNGNVTAAAEAAGVDRKTAYNQREADSNFKTQWEAAKALGLEALEDIAIQRALGGSDTLIIFLLKAHDPVRFRERVDVDHTSKGKELALLTADRFAAADKQAEEQLKDWEGDRLGSDSTAD